MCIRMVIKQETPAEVQLQHAGLQSLSVLKLQRGYSAVAAADAAATD